MKISVLTAVGCILFLGVLSCQKDPTRGMVAYYSFEGNANDQSGKGNDGVVDGVTLTTDRFGNENSAYRFDGIHDNILAEVTGMPASDAPQSFSWWYWVDAIPTFADEWGAGNMIALVDTSGGIGIQAGFRGPGYQSLGLDIWKWGGGTLLEVAPPAVNIWHHCVYTFDGAAHRFYTDGKEEAHSTETPQHGIPTQLMFGNYPSGDQFFEGRLDEIRIYNRALTLSEIKSLYAERND